MTFGTPSYYRFESVLASYGYVNTEENRKYFLYGCGLHSITDAFAHSTAKKVNGEYVRINHENRADSKKICENRYDIACRITEYALDSLKANAYIDGYEVRKAVKHELENETIDFRVIDLQENLVANGYTANTEVKNVTIKSSQTKLPSGNYAN